MQKIKYFITALIVSVGIFAVCFDGGSVMAQSAKTQIQQGVDNVGGSSNTAKLPELIKTITNILFFLLGAIAVIAIILGGIRYTTANGDQSQLKGAKDTILYAVIGLIVALLAFAIVNFVLEQFGK